MFKDYIVRSMKSLKVMRSMKSIRSITCMRSVRSMKSIRSMFEECKAYEEYSRNITENWGFYDINVPYIKNFKNYKEMNVLFLLTVLFNIFLNVSINYTVH